MSAFNKLLLMLTAVCVLAVGISFRSVGAGDVSLQIANNSTDPVVVTVYDLNTRSHRAVLADQRIYGFSSVLVSVAADAGGKGHVLWTATSRDTGATLCGHDNQHGLAEDDSVDVYADAACTQT